MIVVGFAFGFAVMRAGVLPRWTGATLIAGMILTTWGSIVVVAER